jgi:hypothetical protein
MAVPWLKEKGKVVYDQSLRLFYKTKSYFPLMFMTLICVTDVKYYFSVVYNGNTTFFVFLRMILAMFGTIFGIHQLLLPTIAKELITKGVCRYFYGETAADDFPEPVMSREEFLNQFEYFTLHIGDQEFSATKAELMQRPSIFRNILEHDTPYKVNNQGCITIMQNSKYFKYILQYLKSGKTEFSEQNFSDLSKCQNAHGVLMDAQFYKLPELVTICQTFLQNYSNYQGYQRMCYTEDERKLVIKNQEIAAFFVLGQARQSEGEKAYFQALVYAVDKLYSFGEDQPNVNFVLDLSEKTAKSYIDIYYKTIRVRTIMLFDGTKLVANPEADISAAISYIWEYKLYAKGLNKHPPVKLGVQKMITVNPSNTDKTFLSITNG